MALSRIAIAACTVASLASAVHADPSFEKRDDLPAGYNAAPYYPAPYGGWADEWRDSYAKAKKLVDSMTLAEKTNITAGTGIFMGKRRILLQATFYLRFGS
ncbi:Putative Beta-glucosidase 2 [[Torrubiella] hemipterigena]|uniref:Putative Beta-glucosidase 2 n=1 Tax=[Torrubiella] hemipterigena TaxID=1531966 RepID=A0A0A1T4K8_9HYPO|nr:Putative Beta-glucosidase 2 [[Torrubiella] hemipterigena]